MLQIIKTAAISLLTFTLSLTTTTLALSDDGLYEKPLSATSAFVRNFARPEVKELPIEGEIFSTKNLTWARYNAFDTTDFQGLEAGTFYSVIPSGNGALKTHKDAEPAVGKAMLHLINLGDDAPVSLKTADGSIPIILDVAKGEILSREVNPLTLDFKVFGSADYGSENVALKPNEIRTFVLKANGEVQSISDKIQDRR